MPSFEPTHAGHDRVGFVLHTGICGHVGVRLVQFGGSPRPGRLGSINEVGFLKRIGLKWVGFI
eukprot:scaffold1328_cov108-Cylindrotheca_fusiformis.AAC.2